jgi:hypothetical protein
MWKSLFLSTLTAAVGGLAVWTAMRLDTPAPAGPPVRRGEALLQAYQCLEAETKEIILRGVEDDFSPRGEEPANIDPRLAGTRYALEPGTNVFDYSGTDQQLQDHFYLPPHTASALFVIRLRANGNNQNDSIQIGNYLSQFEAQTVDRMFFSSRLRFLPDLEGWQIEGEYYWAQLSDIQMGYVDQANNQQVLAWHNPPMSVLDYVQHPDSDGLVAINIGDDTSVDFLGVAACSEPAPGHGLTFVQANGPAQFTVSQPEARIGGIAFFNLEGTEDTVYRSNPYVGDTPCETELPLACFRPLELPQPRSYDDRSADDEYEWIFWSGGIVAGTPQVAASAFSTIDDADAHCAQEFGTDWRTLTYHDGGRPGRVMAYGGLQNGPGTRAWIDIRGQPYATCWAHPDPHD